MNQLKIYGYLILLVAGLQACTRKAPATIDNSEVLHQNQDLLTQVIIYDVFTPPVASRIYVYSSLASYEAIRFARPGAPSIAERLHGFVKMPQPEPGKQYNYTLAATTAFFKVARNIKVFSVDSLVTYERNIYGQFRENSDTATFSRSVAFGERVAETIMERAMADGYSLSRGKPKYLGSLGPGKWRPTPPDYLDGVEWCWNTMKPMVMDSAAQLRPPGPPPYSKDTNSAFFRSALEVYTIAKHLTSDQRTIARYWDDNPFVMEHAGHLAFGTKKITPGGHWMGIAAIAARQTKADPVRVAEGYAMTAIALYDAFIACWDEKYRSSFIRPVTIINESIDRGFMPFLQTPPFPEYPSGHSAITASASTVLAHLYGDHFSFQDTSDLRYIGMQRHFNSFQEAAAEASVSRVYGGIHIMSSVVDGAEQGKKVAHLIIQKLGNK